MQQDRDKGGGSEDVDPPDRRLKPAQSENQQQQLPQKCPRCDSINTKFCYYNNYSLSQPRYFCKTCRRYWTQGGTLRNVPVGGGCRKTKRKPSASGDNSRSQLPTQQQQQNLAAPPPNIISTNSGVAVGPPLRIAEPANLSPAPAPASAPTLSSVNPYYPAGAFLSSLPAMRPLNQPQPQPFNQPVNVGRDFGGSNLAILQGFNVPSLGSQQQQRQQAEFYQMGNRDRNIESLYGSGEDLIQSSRPTGHQNNWHQTFINPTATDSNLWSIGGSSNNNSNAASSSFNQNHWADLQGYGPPP